MAAEIRRLAESTRTATREMDGLMSEIRRRAEATAEISTRLDQAVTQSEGASHAAEAALSSISQAFEDIVETFGTVERAIAEQAARTEQHGQTAEALLQTARQHFADSAESELSINAIEFHGAQVHALTNPRTIGQVTKLRVGFATAIDSLPGRTLSQFKTLTEARTNGAIRVELDQGYNGGQLACMRDVRLGEIAVTSVNCSIIGNLIPSAQLVELPYLFESREHAFRLLDSDYGRELLTAISNFDSLGLGYIENGLRHIANSRNPIHKPSDMNEMRMRTLESPIHIFIADALRTFPTPIPMPKLYKAVESGAVDAQDNPLANFLAMDLWRVQPYLTLTAHSYTPQVIIANAQVFEQLGEQRAVVDDVLREVFAWHRQVAADVETNALQQLQRKIDVHWPTAEERRAFIEATSPVYARAAKLVGDADVARIKAAARSAGAGLGIRSA